MKQLPGRARPLWIRRLTAGTILVVTTIWVVALMPLLLVLTLLLSLLMIPVMRRLRREFDTLSTEDSAARPPVDVTPWQRQVVNAWRSPAGRPSGKDWGSAGDRGSGSR